MSLRRKKQSEAGYIILNARACACVSANGTTRVKLINELVRVMPGCDIPNNTNQKRKNTDINTVSTVV